MTLGAEPALCVEEVNFSLPYMRCVYSCDNENGVDFRQGFCHASTVADVAGCFIRSTISQRVGWEICNFVYLLRNIFKKYGCRNL